MKAYSYIHVHCTVFIVHTTEGQKGVQVEGLDDVNILSHIVVQV